VKRLDPHLLDTTGADAGDALLYDAAGNAYAPGPIPASGVQSISAGTNTTVDNTDPAHPVVSATGPGELLMADGVTSPPVPIETEAGDDWLYQD
jgi:hypothetical protein